MKNEGIKQQNTTDKGMEYEPMLVTVGKKQYLITDEKIQAGDLIYSVNAKVIDKCIDTFENASLCAEFKNGRRGLFREKLYKKATKQ